MMWNPFGNKKAKPFIHGVVDAVVARLTEYEVRAYTACDGNRPYTALALVKRPVAVDLDGDGQPG